MILLDSVYINNGGGLVLLKYLVSKLKENEDVFFLFDNRVQDMFTDIDYSKKKFISNSILERHIFYNKNKNTFSKVLCFGNLPPTIKLGCEVFVYFHQPLFLKIPDNLPLMHKLSYLLKQSFLNFFKKNANYWLVQSNYVAQGFASKYLSGFQSKIIKAPFYPVMNFTPSSETRKLGSLLYVSNSSPHKNHYRLIQAFCCAFDILSKGSLLVTIPDSDNELCGFIQEKINLGYPIRNVGFIDRDRLANLYLTHEYLIFPSLAESFGLGLAEAIDGGCKIIAADLSYTYEVCEPSLIFNPYDIESMKNAIIKAIVDELPNSKKLIENDISKITQLLAE